MNRYISSVKDKTELLELEPNIQCRSLNCISPPSWVFTMQYDIYTKQSKNKVIFNFKFTLYFDGLFKQYGSLNCMSKVRKLN